MTTPVRQQYLAIKRQYPDVLLFFRLGDFYEMFEEDAKIAARVLDITLTSREMGRGQKLPLAGVPYHSAEAHIARLIAAGYKVAVCEQIGQPVKGRDLVERRVTRVVTPGTVVEPSMLPGHANNYLAAVLVEGTRAGIAYADITTGEFAATQLIRADAETTEGTVAQELLRLGPAEILLPRGEEPDGDALLWLPMGAFTSRTDAREWRLDLAEEALLGHFGVPILDGFGVAGQPLAIRAAGALLHYLGATQLDGLGQITELHGYSTDAYMPLDAATRRNLELTEGSRGGRGGSLLATIDRTRTPLGGRLLRRWLGQPLVELAPLLARQEAVALFVRDALLRARATPLLARVGDLERLINRAVTGAATPRDLATLARSLGILPELLAAIGDDVAGPLVPWLPPLGAARLGEIAATIAAAIADDPPAALGPEVHAIRAGFAPDLDELRRMAREAKAYIAGLERTERERTGIRGLKVGYNKVFGYYLEISNANREAIPADYIRKQTLVGAERYITPELKEYETLVSGAEERIAALEGTIYREVVGRVAGAAPYVLRAAEALAHLDLFAALATVATERRYVRPTLTDDPEPTICIEGGRHPTVEASLAVASESFVPNDTNLDTAERQLVLITGPNMAGKSTYLRQVALIVLLAQIGAFVPADRAEIGLVDRIYTRIGAQDDLAAGQSTFMVEMLEMAAILNSATRRSLIVLDEIGRGTSTYDGLSIARAVTEHIHNTPRLGCRTLFATHYHELTALAELLPRVHNERMAVLEEGDRVVFLRRVVAGGADRSYGIHVAGLAGMPRAVVRRAGEILAELEGGGEPTPRRGGGHRAAMPPPPQFQLSLFGVPDPVVDELRALDVESLSPLEAITKLYELKQKATGVGK
jgi:DNA mismatch repair protein MutS